MNAVSLLRSLASHGEGQDGAENFHVWLMAEPAHRKIMALDNVSEANNLDTAADSYHAFWSKDSRRVAVTFRRDRHQAQFNLYRVENRRIHLVDGPDLFKEVIHRDVTDADDKREYFAAVEWHEGNRFRLNEYRSFLSADDTPVNLFGAYGRVTEKLADGKLFIAFSPSARSWRVTATRSSPSPPGAPRTTTAIPGESYRHASACIGLDRVSPSKCAWRTRPLAGW